MALIKANSTNIFPGAIVFKGSEQLIVYKVNDKSFYAGKIPYQEFNNKINDSKLTFTAFAKTNGVTKFEYGVIQVSEEEVNRKAGFIKMQEMVASQKKYLDKLGEKDIQEKFNRFLKNKSYKYPSFIALKQIVVVAFNKDTKIALLHINEDWTFYDLTTKIYIPFNKKIHYNKPNIVWPTTEVLSDLMRKVS